MSTSDSDGGTRIISSTDFVIGILFITSGLIMKHVCDGEDSTICSKIYDDGQILLIVGSVLLALPFVILILAICCIATFKK